MLRLAAFGVACDGKQLSFRTLQGLHGRQTLILGRFGNRCTRIQKLPVDRLIADNPGIVSGMSGRGHVIGQSRQECRAADTVELRVAAERLGDGHEVNRLAFLVELPDCLVDCSVNRVVKILRLDGTDDVHDAFGVQ